MDFHAPNHGFRGIRYNLAQAGSLSEVVAPCGWSSSNPTSKSTPQDATGCFLESGNQVDSQLDGRQSTYHASKLVGTSSDPASKTAASLLFRQWLRSGVLEFEPDPALYVYHQVFHHGHATYTRRGFYSRLALDDPTPPSFELPNEVRQNELRDELRSVEANLVPILGVYPDESNTIQNRLEQEVVGTADWRQSMQLEYCIDLARN